MTFNPVAATNMVPIALGELTEGIEEVLVDGKSVVVHDTEAASFVILTVEHPVTISVRCCETVDRVVVRPLNRDIATEKNDATVTFVLERPMNLSVEIGTIKPLFVFANAPETNRPDPADPMVKYFGGGGVHELDIIELTDGQTLYIEEGTVLQARIRATNACGVRIAGRGILDGSRIERKRGESRFILLDHCRDVTIEDIVLINPVSWMIVLVGCNTVMVDGIREIGICVSSDGIDIVGGRNVTIQNTFQRNNDDSVVLKGTTHDRIGGDIENVLVQNCVLLNADAGNVMEIGYETRCDRIKGITFRNIDVIGSHGYDGVFTIHNAERALVTDVLYEDIRVEGFFDKLIDFQVFWSRYSRESLRGQIRNVTLRNITTVADRFNTVSLIGGDDAAHTVEGVTIDHFVMGDLEISNPDQLHLFVKHARDVVIRHGGGETRVC